MKPFRTWLLAIPLVLTGCFLFSSGPSSEVGRTPEELRNVREYLPPVYDAFSYGSLHEVSVGQWVRYRITEGENVREITLGISGRNDEGTWIEIVGEESVSAQLVSKNHLVLRALYRHRTSDGESSPVYSQEIIQGTERVEEKEPPGDRTEQKGTVKVGEMTLPVIRVEIEREDFNGRISTESRVWSDKVPTLYAKGKAGGLVFRQRPGQTVSLIGFGSDYSPRIEN